MHYLIGSFEPRTSRTQNETSTQVNIQYTPHASIWDQQMITPDGATMRAR